MAKRSKKLTKEERAEMPAEFGAAHAFAKNKHEKRHRNRKKYSRKDKPTDF